MELFWTKLVINHHVLAGISLVGVVLDVLGGLYLTYDLLGNTRGPLRTLTQMVTYSLVFGVIYGAILGLPFGIVVGLGFGFITGYEFRHLKVAHKASVKKGLHWPTLLLGLLRGVVLGLAAELAFRGNFGWIFGLLSALGLIGVYVLRLSPTDTYQAEFRRHITRQSLLATVIRGLVISGAGVLAGLIAHTTVTVGFGLEIGIVVGFAGAIVSLTSPLVEAWVDSFPTRFLGVSGIVLILIGFLLQSLQYWVAFLDIPVR